MVRLEQISYDDFLTVRADDPADQVAALLAQTNTQRVIVRRRHDGDTQYYIFHRDDLLARLGKKKGMDLEAAADLLNWQEAPLADADSDEETSPDLCVIKRHGELIGYYDADVRVGTVRSYRSGSPVSEAAITSKAVELERVRQVHADFPQEVPQEESVALQVSLRSASTGGSEPPIAVADGMIDVVVRPEQGFVLDGPGAAQLRVTDEDESPPIEFRLRAAEVGPGRIKVYALQGGVPLGSVTVHALILPRGQRSTGYSGGATGALAPPPAADADLTLLVRDWPDQRGRCLEYTLKAADPAVELYFKRFYSKPFQVDPQAYFRQFYFGLDQRLLAAGATDIEDQIAAYGASLFEDLFPEALRALLWTLQDRIKTVQVLSDEPWIPWELVKLSRLDGSAGVVDGPFLCRAFRLTRWFPEIPRRPRLRLRNLAVVVPKVTGLANAMPERDYLLGLAEPGVRTVTPVPAQYSTFRTELLNGLYDGWHFVGHAAADPASPDESLLALDEGKYLRANDISGAVKNCGRKRPLVFLNGCQTVQGAMGLTGAGGWAARFIGAGAAAFVGTLWSVKDESAQTFTSSFYDRLLAGMTVADAAFEARAAAGVTGLAYSVFADPFASVVRGG